MFVVNATSIKIFDVSVILVFDKLGKLIDVKQFDGFFCIVRQFLWR